MGRPKGSKNKKTRNTKDTYLTEIMIYKQAYKEGFADGLQYVNQKRRR